MKQIVVLEHSDLTRLKCGETIELTKGLLLSIQTRSPRKPKKPRWQCPKCERVFATGNALGPHKRHCKGDTRNEKA